MYIYIHTHARMHTHTVPPIQEEDMTIIYISFLKLFDELSGHHTQAKYINLIG